MDVRYSIKNMEGLLNAFEKAPAIAKRNMILATKVAARDVKREAQNTHKFVSRSGNLEKAITDTVITDLGGGTIVGQVYIDEGVAKYGVFQHEGTGLYGPSKDYIKIFPRNRKWLRWATPGGFVYAKQVLKNPGVKGDPFLYDAANRKRVAINAIFDKYTERAIKEAGL